MSLSDLPESEVCEQDLLLESHASSPKGWKRVVVALVAGAGIVAVASFSKGSQRPQWAMRGPFSMLSGEGGEDYQFVHMSADCVKALIELESKSDNHEGLDMECDDDHMKCGMVFDDELAASKCFPGGGVCLPANIAKEVYIPTGMRGTLVCQDGDEKTETPLGDMHITEECEKALMEIESTQDNYDGPDAECKEDQMRCDIFIADQVEGSKCFPGGGLCKVENIAKTLDMPKELKATLTCQEGDEKTEIPLGSD